MGVLIYSFNMNFSHKMSYSVLECVLLCDRITCWLFCNKGFCNKRGVICARPYVFIWHYCLHKMSQKVWKIHYNLVLCLVYIQVTGINIQICIYMQILYIPILQL